MLKAAENLNDDINLEEILKNPVLYEVPGNTVNISIDDVNVKKQEESREKGKFVEEHKRKYVHNTVVHVEQEQKTYVLNGYGMKTVLSYVIAFIFHNNLTDNRFQFFTDGHTVLNNTIINCFSWYYNMGIILDWFHLEKKCKEQLSMAMKNRELRNQLLEKLTPLLWYGLIDKAICLLNETDIACQKNSAAMEKLKDYLSRNRPYIPCYAIRRELGLSNSSSIGEKMNDLVVAERQKHNGMSWSKPGSVALASITSLKRNNEQKKWFGTGSLDFKLAA